MSLLDNWIYIVSLQFNLNVNLKSTQRYEILLVLYKLKKDRIYCILFNSECFQWTTTLCVHKC